MDGWHADLGFLLGLQLCLASDSRHMSHSDWQVGRYPLGDLWLGTWAERAGFKTVGRGESP